MTTANYNVPADVINKIRSALKLADPTRGGTEAEVAAALNAVSKLVNRYNVDLANIGEASIKSSVVEQTGSIGSAFKWKRYVANQIAKAYFCRLLYTARTDKVFFIGQPGNIDIIKAILEIVLAQMSDLRDKELSPARQRWGYTHGNSDGYMEPFPTAAWTNSFFWGLAERLGERIQQDQEEAVRQSGALAIFSKANDDFIDEKYPTLKKAKPKKMKRRRWISDGIATGTAAAERVNFRSQVRVRGALGS